MICSLEHLNAAIDWLNRIDAPRIVSPIQVVAEYRGWPIIRDIHYGIASGAERLDVAPWVVEELGKLATVET